MFKKSFSTIPISAGAYGMGCIGYPAHPVWEVTTRCNLNCIHCHVSAGQGPQDELNTTQALSVIDQLRRIPEFRMLVYTGGEPMVRPDIFELLEHSYRRGFINVIATNATLIDKSAARRLRHSGVAGAAVSLDSSCARTHNHIRGDAHAFRRAMEGIEALKSAGIPIQINITAMDCNFSELDALLDQAGRLGAVIVLLYQLVAVGRGNDLAGQALDKSRNEALIKFIREKQKNFSGIIEPVATPQFWAYLVKQKFRNNGFGIKIAQKLFHGCCAGRGFVYIKANGDIWPCPFIETSAGNAKHGDFQDIWKNSPVFQALRSRETLLKGKCGTCDYRSICGGCRGRALALGGDIMQEDPICFL